MSVSFVYRCLYLAPGARETKPETEPVLSLLTLARALDMAGIVTLPRSSCGQRCEPGQSRPGRPWGRGLRGWVTAERVPGRGRRGCAGVFEEQAWQPFPWMESRADDCLTLTRLGGPIQGKDADVSTKVIYFPGEFKIAA